MISVVDDAPTRAELLAELEALRAENARLRGLLGLDARGTDLARAGWSPTLFAPQSSTAETKPIVDQSSPRPAKVALFRSLFAGREDVYALRWQNRRTGKGGWGPAVQGGWANARRPDRELLSFTDDVAEAHLAGEVNVGLYPLLPGDACRVLACDFDGAGWVLDALAYLDAGRNCLVLTRWTEHLDVITDMLSGRGLEPLVLHGKMGKKARTAVTRQLAEPRPDGGLLLVATASLIGEGFDCPPLDTLFLAFPIKFKGNVVQYVGRVLCPTDTKTRVEVHDYVDGLVPVLARQHDERRTAYATLGFDVPRGRPHRGRTGRTP